MRPFVVATLAFFYLAACTVYFGGDDDQELCAASLIPVRLVDPATLTCQDFYVGDCPAGCGPCDVDQAPLPTWGACESACTGLDELPCMDRSGCRAAHDWACWTGDGPCTLEVSYLGCFAVDTTGPVQGPCEGLGADACSRHDDCLALHGGDGFVACVNEMR